MKDVPSDYEFDVATINASLHNGRGSSVSDYTFALSTIRHEVVTLVADFVFGASSKEKELVRVLLNEHRTLGPKLEMRLRYAVATAPVLLQVDWDVRYSGLSERIDLIADTNMAKCGGGLSLPNDRECANAMAIAFLLNNPNPDVAAFEPDDIWWVGQNMERLMPLAHLIRERNMQLPSDIKRLLDAPAPALVEGVL